MAQLMKDTMWKIPLEVRDGENEYTVYVYFFGTGHDAEKYGASYASTFFGFESGETTWDNIDRCWYENGGTRAVRVSPPIALWLLRPVYDHEGYM